MIILLMLMISCPLINMCKWPKSDILFILDGSYNVNQYEHEQEVSFMKKCMSDIDVSAVSSKVAVAQFTPRAQFEWGLVDVEDNEEVIMKLQQVFYSPCDTMDKKQNCTPVASLNHLAKIGLENGNRKWIPDIIILISNSRYKLPDIGEKEVLMSPTSPIHIFQVTINSNSQKPDSFEPSATNIRLNAIDFNALDHLVDPLCQSVNQFVGEKNHSKFGSLCWTVSVVLGTMIILLILLCCYIVYFFRNENKKIKRIVYEYEKSLRSQNEYFTSKLHAQMEDNIKAGAKYAEEITKQQLLLKDAQDELKQHLKDQPSSVLSTQPPIIIPVYQQSDNKENNNNNSSNNNNNINKDDQHNVQRNASNIHKKRTLEVEGREDLHLRFDGTQLEVTNGHISTRLTSDEKANDPSSVTLQLSTKKNQDSVQEELNREKIRIDHEQQSSRRPKHSDGALTNRRAMSRLDFGESLASRYWKEDPNHISSETEDISSTDEVPTRGYLAADHPARTLPPIDLLFLFDSSSSIGITNFDAMKANVIKVLEDVDIGPGRSRVALIQYAQEPSVVFGFDKYYSLDNVKKGINRMSYTGGATMLAKALSFAAGILYKEQNLKESRRKNKLMLAPRHDRLQIICLVSDGTSDDNIHKAASYIHEKLQAKVLGVVSKSFNKDKLLPVTKFEGATFVMTHTESISIWLWRQQKVWAENYNSFLEQDKALSISHKRSHRN